VTSSITPLVFFGGLAAVTATMILFTEVFVRWFTRNGLTQGGLPPRPHESSASHTERSRQYDRRELDLLRRRRPLTLLLLAVGLAVLLAGLLA
jgi:hypothetical protein